MFKKKEFVLKYSWGIQTMVGYVTMSYNKAASNRHFNFPTEMERSDFYFQEQYPVFLFLKGTVSRNSD
jgi:hypothetical protein